MNWFNYILNKFGHWDDPEEDPEDALNRHDWSQHINWMEMMPNGERFWQVSLKEAFRKGKEEYGHIWDERDPSWNDEIATGISPAQMFVFLEWWDKVSGPLTNMQDMVDDYVEQLGGFRPFETPGAAPDSSVDVPNSEDFERWMNG